MRKSKRPQSAQLQVQLEQASAEIERLKANLDEQASAKPDLNVEPIPQGSLEEVPPYRHTLVAARKDAEAWRESTLFLADFIVLMLSDKVFVKSLSKERLSRFIGTASQALSIIDSPDDFDFLAKSPMQQQTVQKLLNAIDSATQEEKR